MKYPTSIESWEWPDTEYVPDGYNMKQQPKLSQANFLFLIERYNELAEALYELIRESDQDERYMPLP